MSTSARRSCDPQLGLELRDVLYPDPAARSPRRRGSHQTAVTQPALFVVEYALAMAWRRLGIEPDGMIGHSVGEYVAACLGRTSSPATTPSCSSPNGPG